MVYITITNDNKYLIIIINVELDQNLGNNYNITLIFYKTHSTFMNKKYNILLMFEYNLHYKLGIGTFFNNNNLCVSDYL